MQYLKMGLLISLYRYEEYGVVTISNFLSNYMNHRVKQWIFESSPCRELLHSARHASWTSMSATISITAARSSVSSRTAWCQRVPPLCLGAGLPQLDFCALRRGANAGVAREGWARDFLSFDFRPFQGGVNGGMAQERCGGATS